MGFALTWVAFKGLTAAEASSCLGLKATGIHDSDFYGVGIAGKQFSTGWYVIVLNRHVPRKGFIASLSTKTDVMFGEIEEHVMFNSSEYWHQSQQLWSIIRNSEKGTHHLEASGSPPQNFEKLKLEAMRKADEPESCDTLFSVPSELAAQITGFEYEAQYAQPDWEKLSGLPKGFTSLKVSCLMWTVAIMGMISGLVLVLRWLLRSIATNI